MGLGNAKGLSQPPLHMQKEARGRWRSPVLVATLATLHRGQRLCGKLFLPPAPSLPFATMERAVLKLSSSPSLSLSLSLLFENSDPPGTPLSVMPFKSEGMQHASLALGRRCTPPAPHFWVGGEIYLCMGNVTVCDIRQ